MTFHVEAGARISPSSLEAASRGARHVRGLRGRFDLAGRSTHTTSSVPPVARRRDPARRWPRARGRHVLRRRPTRSALPNQQRMRSCGRTGHPSVHARHGLGRSDGMIRRSGDDIVVPAVRTDTASRVDAPPHPTPRVAAARRRRPASSASAARPHRTADGSIRPARARVGLTRPQPSSSRHEWRGANPTSRLALSLA
jgi:hypothetical protein